MTDDSLTECDVLIVGGGPAGSSCARRLVQAGRRVVVLDKAEFPRDKTCAGWITPPIVRTLGLSLSDYRTERVAQPITGFRTGLIGRQSAVETRYPEPVSFGIRRCEFDDYLLQRAGAELRLGESLASLKPASDGWVVNGTLRAAVVVGAGGHFCPVGRRLNPDREHQPDIVQAQEIEFPLTPEQAAECRVEGETPELYFCPDLRGYGWCFRKGEYLNVGLGREGERHLGDHVAAFVEFLRETGRVEFDLPGPFKGHAYRLYGRTVRRLVADRALLIGDAAGLAVPQSGEGIRPAIESGLMAAEVLLAADGDFRESRLQTYERWIRDRFGAPGRKGAADFLPSWARQAVARWLLGTRRFTRQVLLDGWFLHTEMADLDLADLPTAAD